VIAVLSPFRISATGGASIVSRVWINWTIRRKARASERASECRRPDKADARFSVTLADQAQSEQTPKPEVTFAGIAWEFEAELVDELENCSHPRRDVARSGIVVKLYETE